MERPSVWPAMLEAWQAPAVRSSTGCSRRSGRRNGRAATSAAGSPPRSWSPARPTSPPGRASTTSGSTITGRRSTSSNGSSGCTAGTTRSIGRRHSAGRRRRGRGPGRRRGLRGWRPATARSSVWRAIGMAMGGMLEPARGDARRGDHARTRGGRSSSAAWPRAAPSRSSRTGRGRSSGTDAGATGRRCGPVRDRGPDTERPGRQGTDGPAAWLLQRSSIVLRLFFSCRGASPRRSRGPEVSDDRRAGRPPGDVSGRPARSQPPAGGARRAGSNGHERRDGSASASRHAPIDPRPCDRLPSSGIPSGCTGTTLGRRADPGHRQVPRTAVRRMT